MARSGFALLQLSAGQATVAFRDYANQTLYTSPLGQKARFRVWSARLQAHVAPIMCARSPISPPLPRTKRPADADPRAEAGYILVT